MAIRHLTAAAVAATLSLSLVACGGSAEPEANPTPTSSAPASTLLDRRADPRELALGLWKEMSDSDQEEVCGLLTSGDRGQVVRQFVYDESYSVSQDFLDVATTVCDSRARTAEAMEAIAADEAADKAAAKRQRQAAERERKIDAVGDTSLTDDQAVAVYDAVCEYLNTPGAEGDIIALGEAGINALPPGSTPQQQWDASVAAGYLLGSGACR